MIFFWAAYEQAGSSLTLFADEQTNRSLFGWEMPASYFQAFNPLFVVALAFVMPFIWSFLNKRNHGTFLHPSKQAIGLFLLSLGYLFIAIGVKDLQPGVKVSMLWLTGLYFIHTMGEMALSPIGLSMVNRLTPVRFASFNDGCVVISQLLRLTSLPEYLVAYIRKRERLNTFFGVPIVSVITISLWYS